MSERFNERHHPGRRHDDDRAAFVAGRRVDADRQPARAAGPAPVECQINITLEARSADAHRTHSDPSLIGGGAILARRAR